MSHLDDELLADAALGLDRLAAGARAHLDQCAACGRTVDDLRRTAALVSASAGALPVPGVWESPPPHVWHRIAATIATGSAPTTSSITERVAPVRRSRRVWPWATGLAAAGLAVGLLTGRSLWSGDDTTGATIARVELGTIDTQQRLGEATVVRIDSRVDLEIATTTSFDASDGYLEVWLINSDGKRMVSVGVLDTESGTFPISQDLLDQGYVVVDISREPFDDRPQHSGDSLVRGTLPT